MGLTLQHSTFIMCVCACVHTYLCFLLLTKIFMKSISVHVEFAVSNVSMSTGGDVDENVPPQHNAQFDVGVLDFDCRKIT
jgi:hypothetical protein